MKNLILKYRPELIGIMLGSFAGWSYWYFIGCASGTCAITSSPFNSTIYGAFVGGFIANAFKKTDEKENSKY